MFRWLFFVLVVGGVCVAVAVHFLGVPTEVQAIGNKFGDYTKAPEPGPAPATTSSSEPRVGVTNSSLPEATGEPADNRPANATPLFTISDGRLAVLDKQDVSSENGGKLLFIGTEYQDGEPLGPTDQIFQAETHFVGVQLGEGVKIEVTNDPLFKGPDGKANYRRWREGDPLEPNKLRLFRQTKKYRRLKEGDEVREGQLLALVNPARILEEVSISLAKFNASEAEWKASVKTRDEALKRWESTVKANRASPNAVSLEDVRGAELLYDKYTFEAVKNFEGIDVARADLNKNLTDLKLHEIRSSIPGVIKVINKNKGEAISVMERQNEVLLQIQNPRLLQIEGQLEVQNALSLKRGDELIVEPSHKQRFDQVFRGHMGGITAVAVSKDGQVVSASDDGTVRVWDRATGKQKASFVHPQRVPVRAVACTPPDTTSNYVLTGASDGVARLWDLANPSSKPVRELADERRRSSSINCVAFSPNGHWCATGGEDNMVCLWDVDSGTLLQKMQSHRGRVTSVQFLSPTQLVTCGGDKVLCLWTLADDGKPKFLNRFEGRGGEVTQLGVDPAKKEVLFDQGKELHVLAMPGGEFEGALQNPSRAMGFTTMALFSPDAKLVLTNDASRNYLQLWRAPNPKTRAYELRQLVWDGQPTTCGAFSPDGTFMVTGTADRHVLVWPVPTPKEVDEQLTAKVTTLENSVEGDLNKVRMKAELTNPGYLMPGDKATLVVYPRR